MGQDHHAAVLCRELGRPRSASSWQFRGLRTRRSQTEMAGGARHRTLDAFLYRLRPRTAAALFRSIPAREKRWLGKTAQSAAASTSHRQVRATGRERMAAQAHQMDQILSRPVCDDTDTEK